MSNSDNSDFTLLCNLEYIKRDKELFARDQHIAELPVAFDRADGFYLYDANGKAYLDFTSGACTMNLGYSVPPVDKFASFPFPYCVGTRQVEYASELIKKFHFAKDVKMIFTVTGSDANDGAIKFARAYTGRKKIVAFAGNYHGTTYGAASLTTLDGRLSNSFSPMLPEVYILPFVGESATYDESKAVINQLKALDLQSIAGVFLEVVQGDTGMIPMHHDFVFELNRLCKEHNIVFICDEVQMAFYRTGSFYAVENYKGVEPDLITMGKHLGGGIPLGAIIGRAEIMNALNPCEHAFSMMGNSEACARGLYNLKLIEEKSFRQQCENTHKHFAKLLNELTLKHKALIDKVCGVGLARGIFVKSLFKEDTNNDACIKIIARCAKYGLYLMRIGSNWLRIEPFINITSRELEKGFKILDMAFTDYEKGLIDKRSMYL